MEIRSSSEMMVTLTFQVDVSLKDLVLPGGVDEFSKQAHKLLDEQLEPLVEVAVPLEVEAGPVVQEAHPTQVEAAPVEEWTRDARP
jgi:hypothetical protein